jgi:outer membrane protein with glycine zipper
MADVNLSLGVNVDIGDLNRELIKVRRIVENKLKGLKVDISDANVSPRTRAGRVQGALRPELLSASSKERSKAQESAVKALTARINTLSSDLAKSGSKLAELTKKRQGFIALEKQGADAAKKAGTTLSELRRNAGRLGPTIDRVADKQRRLTGELDRTKGALTDLRTFFDQTNRTLDASRNAQARAAGSVENLNKSARGAANALDIFTRLGRSLGRTPVEGQVGDRIGGGGGGRPPAGPARPSPIPGGGDFGNQEFLAAFGRTLTAGIVRGLERLGTESLRLANVTGDVTEGFRRTASAAERLERASERGLQASTARQQQGFTPENRAAAGGQQFATVDPKLALAQERSFAQQRQQVENERTQVTRQINAAALEAGRDFVRSQLEAGKDISEISETLRRTAPASEKFRKVLESEATTAAKAFSTSVITSAQSIKKISGNNIGFGDIDDIVAGAGETLRRRFGLFGAALQRATDLIRTRLTSAIEKRVGEQVRLAQNDAKERTRLAALQAKREGALAASVRGLDTGRTQASQATLQLAQTELARKFQIGGAALAKAVEAFAASFEASRKKTFATAERDAAKIQTANEKYRAAIEATVRAEQERGAAIRRSAASSNLSGGAAGIVGGVAGGLTGGGGSASFRGVGAQLNKLDPGQAQAASRALLGQGQAAARAGVQLSTFSSTIANSNALVRKYAANLRIGERAAFEFGVSAQQAATRLAAWAAPSVFIFQAIGALRTALDTIVRLDTQLRRLSFFQQGEKNPFIIAGKAIAGFETPAQQYRSNLNAIINISEETGLAIESITEAVVTLSRVGKQPLQLNVDTGALEPTRILEAVQGLVRLEGGALSAGRATEILNAILEQNNLDVEDATAVAASLATQSRKTSFDVERLGVVVTGVGSAFRNLQNLTFDETLAIASVAAKRLGTNASRTRTALRQLSTLFVRFSKEIEEATGVEVADDSGQLRNINALFEALEKVNSLKGTTGGFALADLFAEAENIPDLQNLADGAGAFRKELRVVGSSAVGIGNAFAFTEQAVKDFLTQGETQARGFEASVNRLSTSVVKFADDIELDRAFKAFADGAASSLGAISKLINTLGEIPGLLKAIAFVSLAPLLKALGRVGLGFATAAIGARKVTQAQGQLIQGAGAAGAGLQGRLAGGGVIAEAQKEGFLTQQRATNLTQRNNALLESRLITEARINKTKAVAVAIEKKAGGETLKSIKLRKNLGQLEKELVATETRELALQREITAELTKQSNVSRAKKGGKGFGAVAASAAGAIALVAGDSIAAGIGSASGSKKIEGALSGAVAGGLTGALVGSAVPIVGTAIGAAVGAAIGGVGGFFSASSEEEQAQKDRIKREKEITAAIASRRKQIIAAASATLQRNANISLLEEKIIKLRRDAELAQTRVAEAQEKGLSTSKAEIALKVANNKLLQAQVQLQREAEERTKETIRREQDLLAIRTRRARIDIASATLREQAVFNAERAGARGSEITAVKFEFDRQSLKTEASAIQQELNRTNQAAAALQGRKGRGQEQRSLAQRAAKLEQQLQTIRFKALQQEFEFRRDILKEATEEQTKQIDAWKSAAKEVTSAFESILQDQKSIAGLISSNSEININIQKAQQDLRNLIPSLIGDVAARLRIEESAIGAIRRQRGTINAGFGAQRRELESGLGAAGGIQSTEVSLSELAQGAKRLKDALSVIDENELTAQQRQQKAAAEINAGILRQRAQINRRLLDIELSRARALESTIRAEIDARKRLIKSNNDLLDIQAKRGESLLADPEDFLKQLQRISQAQSIFGGAQFSGPGAQANINRRVEAIISRPGGLALAREIEAGLKAAVQQGRRVNPGFSPEDFLRRFRAAVDGGDAAADAGAAIDENVAQLQKLNGTLQENLVEQRKLVGAQFNLQSALNQLNVVQANFARASLSNSEKLTNELTARLAPLEQNFSDFSTKLDGLKTVMETILTSKDFSTGTALITSTIQQLQQSLSLAGRGENIGGGLRSAASARENSIFRLLNAFGGASNREGLGAGGGGRTSEQIDALFKRFESLSGEQVSLLTQLVDRGGKTSKEQAAEIARVFPGIKVSDLVNVVGSLNRGGAAGGLSDIRGGALSAALTTGARGLISRDGVISTSRAQNAISAQLRTQFDPETAKAAESLAVQRGLPELVAILDRAKAALDRSPEDTFAQQNFKSLSEGVQKIIDGIAAQVSTNEVLTQLTAALKVVNDQRAKELERREENLRPGAGTETSRIIRDTLEAATNLQGAAASEERKELVKLLSSSGTGSIITNFEKAIQRLEKTLADGITVTANPINIEFNSNVKTELAANPQLRAALEELTGGNKEEAERALRLLGELIRLENRRGSKLSGEAQAAAGASGG